jgi:hypothetical protein
MRKLFSLLVMVLLLLQALHIEAQNYDDPKVYMKAVNGAMADFNKVYMAYISAAWHSNRAGKIDRLRQQVVDDITTCRYKIVDLPYYKHDNLLRQSNIDYLWLLNKVFNDDYKHLVNMEDLVDQSFDKMELYLLLQEKINDTLKAANHRMDEAEKDFATKYNVTLTDDKSEVTTKMELANKVSKYHNKVYLLFFKCVWQESQVMDAAGKKNITKIEQARSALLKYATDGALGLDSLSSYDNDATLAAACRQSLAFYKEEAETGIPEISDYLLKEENFNKIKTSLDAKPKNSQTQQDKDSYNKALEDMNKAMVAVNKTFKTILADRNKAIINWNNVEQKFSDAHMPYYR